MQLVVVYDVIEPCVSLELFGKGGTSHVSTESLRLFCLALSVEIIQVVVMIIVYQRGLSELTSHLASSFC